MLSKLKICFAIFFITTLLKAQWSWQNPYPQGNRLNDIQFVDSLFGWSVGDFGTIMRTTDGGNRWILEPKQTDANYLKVYFIDRLNGWLSSDNKALYTTNDGGTSWTVYEALKNSFITDIRFLSSGTGYMLDSGANVLLKTTDYGKSWNKIYDNNYYIPITCVFFLDENIGWIGSGSSKVIMTFDSGKSWKISEVPSIDTKITQIQFLDKDNGYLIGYRKGSSVNYPYSFFAYSSNGGNTWIEKPTTGVYAAYTAMHFFSADSGYIASDNNSDSQIYYTADGGKNWKWTFTPAGRLTFVSRNKGWGISRKSQIITIYKDPDMKISGQTKAFTANALYSCIPVDSLSIWACGYAGELARSTNGGKNWEEINSLSHTVVLPYYSLVSITYNKSRNEIFSVGSSGAIIKYKSGQMYKNFIDTSKYFNDITFINDTTGFIVGYSNGHQSTSGFIYSTSDGGANWQKTDAFQFGLRQIKFGNSSLGWISAYNAILRTTDSGKSWERLKVPEFSYRDIDAKGNSAWISFGDSVMVTSDAGMTWNFYKVFDSNINTYTTNPVSFLDEKNGFIGLDGRIASTSDGGKSWEEEKQITFNPIHSITCFAKGKAWAVGQEGTVLNYSSNTSDVAKYYSDKLNDYYLNQNYPNPFNPMTTIVYTIPEGQIVKLRVYDLLGKEVASLVNEYKPAGRYSINFNANRLSSGMYIYTIQAGQFRSSKKLLLVK